MRSRWYMYALVPVIAWSLLFTCAGLAKQIPFPEDPPDMSVYSGTPEQVLDKVRDTFSAPFFSDSGPWLDGHSHAQLFTPAYISAWAADDAFRDGWSDIQRQEEYNKRMGFFWHDATTFLVRLESDTAGDFISLDKVKFSLETDSGETWPCEVSKYVDDLPRYNSTYGYWSWLDFVEAPINGPALFADSPKWIRLHMQMGSKRGYFQWDLPSRSASVSSDTDLADRLAALEARVAALEQALRATEQETPSAVPSNQPIARFEGSGLTNTKPFTVDNGWTLEWDARGDLFQLFIYTSSGQLDTVAANQTGSGKGSSYHPQGGTYYLKVNAIGDWKVAITQ